MARKSAKDAIYIYENTVNGSQLRDFITVHVRYGVHNFNGELETQFRKKWKELLEAEGSYSDPDHVTGNFLMDDKWTYSDDWQPGQRFKL
jgi:hypothetical protein